MQRPPIKVTCADGAPCKSITIKDFSMWTDAGSQQLATCRSAYGSGFCLKSGSGASYAQVTQTIGSRPADYTAARMPDDLKNTNGFGTTLSIPIPAIPTSYFPGKQPISKVAGGSGSSPSGVSS